MFSFFNKQEVNIHSVAIPDPGWSRTKDNRSIIQWINPERTIALSVNFVELPPDIPTVTNVQALRDFYRKTISQVNGGLIEVNIPKVHEVPAAKIIIKFPEASGNTYIASLTIPFETCSFVIKAQCVEVGATGLREAIVVDRLMASGELTAGHEGLQNWFADPYDSSIKGGATLNTSEQEIYDKEFPTHPLSQARAIINKVTNEVVFGPEIRKLKRLNR